MCACCSVCDEGIDDATCVVTTGEGDGDATVVGGCVGGENTTDDGGGMVVSGDIEWGMGIVAEEEGEDGVLSPSPIDSNSE